MQGDTKETWTERELDLYFKGRKRLAEMMDVDHPEIFSDDDIAVSVYMYMERLSEVISPALSIIYDICTVSCAGSVYQQFVIFL